MKARHLVMFSAASGALIASAPALAQPEMTYEQPYEYAQPAPPPQAPRVVYRQEAVVQPIPAAPPMSEQAAYDNGYQDAGADYEVEYEYTDAPQARVPGYAPQVMPHQAVPYPHHAMQMQQQPQFDRGAWLDECVSRYNGGEVRRDRNGNIIGGLVGAAAGGLIGNRVAGRGDRLAGSLIGAGIGGLAGLAVGAAIDAASSRHSDRGNDEAWNYCEDYLAWYSSNNSYGYGYQYAQPMMLVPVMIQVPQRAVVHEYVTEETVNVQVVTYEDVPAPRVVRPAPRPTKIVPIKRAPSKVVRQIKGN